MAKYIEKLENPRTGKKRFAPIGFSWTTLFFGPFPALLRGHWIAAIFIAVCCFFTFGLAGIVFAFFYNRWYYSSLINDGYADASAAPAS